MNILYVTVDFPPMRGGIGEYGNGLCSELRQDVVTVVAPKTKSGETVKKFPFNVIRIAMLSHVFRPRWILLWWKLRHIVRITKPDLIIAGQPVISGQAVRRIARARGIPYVVIAHGMDIKVPFITKDKTFNNVSLVLKDASLVVLNSEMTRSVALQYGISKEKTEVVYPATNLEEPLPLKQGEKEDICEKFHIPPNSKIIISVGRLVERKGFDMLIRAFADIQTQDPDTFLIIVGGGPEEARLRSLIDTHGVGHRAMIITNIFSSYDRNQLYRISSVFSLLPRELPNGDVEGFGIVFLEANIMGLPVVAGNSGGVSEAVEDGKNGFLVDPLNSTAAAERILQLLDDSELCKHFVEYGRVRIERRFNYRIQSQILRNAIMRTLFSYGEKN